MVHFSAFRTLENGLNKPCARHDSNVRTLPLGALTPRPALRRVTEESVPVLAGAWRAVGARLALQRAPFLIGQNRRCLNLVLPRPVTAPIPRACASRYRSVMSATAVLPILHLSLITGGELRDRSGGSLGRVEDVIVRLGEEYPPVSGLLAKVAGRKVFVPADVIGEITHEAVTLAAAKLDLRPFERRSQEVLLKKDMLDRQLINVDGARLVRANDIELMHNTDRRAGRGQRCPRVDTGRNCFVVPGWR
jgi:hypothetical protein